MRSLIVIIAAIFLAGCGTTSEPANAGGVSAPVDSTRPAASPAASASPASQPATAASLEPLPPDPQGLQAAIDVIEQYFHALDARDHRTAYELWSGKGEASKQTFEEFRDGFAKTASVEVDTSGEPGDPEGAAGSQYVAIPVRIKAKTTDGREQNFWGEYVLRRSMVYGATADQRAWRIYSAKIEER